MAFTKTEFQPGNKLPASKLNEIQDTILENVDKLNVVNDSIEDIKSDVSTLQTKTRGAVASVNGVAPDEKGNVEIEAGGVDEEDLVKYFPRTISLDFTNWVNGSFTENLSDGTNITHDVLFDGNGNVIGVGDITIGGLN